MVVSGDWGQSGGQPIYEYILCAKVGALRVVTLLIHQSPSVVVVKATSAEGGGSILTYLGGFPPNTGLLGIGCSVPLAYFTHRAREARLFLLQLRTRGF